MVQKKDATIQKRKLVDSKPFAWRFCYVFRGVGRLIDSLEFDWTPWCLKPPICKTLYNQIWIISPGIWVKFKEMKPKGLITCKILQDSSQRPKTPIPTHCPGYKKRSIGTQLSMLLVISKYRLKWELIESNASVYKYICTGVYTWYIHYMRKYYLVQMPIFCLILKGFWCFWFPNLPPPKKKKNMSQDLLWKKKKWWNLPLPSRPRLGKNAPGFGKQKPPPQTSPTL